MYLYKKENGNCGGVQFVFYFCLSLITVPVTGNINVTDPSYMYIPMA